VDDNFFSCVSFRTLRIELRELDYELQKVIPSIAIDDARLSEADKQRYIVHVKEKREVIEKQMRIIAKEEMEFKEDPGATGSKMLTKKKKSRIDDL